MSKCIPGWAGGHDFKLGSVIFREDLRSSIVGVGSKRSTVLALVSMTQRRLRALMLLLKTK